VCCSELSACSILFEAHCRELWLCRCVCVAVCCSVLQHVAVCCSALQLLQSNAMCCNEFVSVFCFVLKRAAYICDCASEFVLQSNLFDVLKDQLDVGWFNLCIFIYSDVSKSTRDATYCNILQHTATYCIDLGVLCVYSYIQMTEIHTHCNTLQHTATHCNTLQHTATHCNTLQHTATHCNYPY